MKKLKLFIQYMCVAGTLAIVLNTQAQTAPPTPPPSSGTNDPLTSDQLAAQQAAIAAVQQADYDAQYAPWVVQDFLAPDNGGLQIQQTQTATSLLTLSGLISSEYVLQQNAITAYVQTNAMGMPASWLDTNGNIHIIDRIENGIPAIKTTFNTESAITVGADKLWPGGSSGMGLTGTNVVLGLIDGGDPLTNHQEFAQSSGRVKEIFGPSTLGTVDHATHTCGTMAAWGLTNSAKGFANRSTIWTTDFQNDLGKMPILASTNGGVRTSNHSYGYSRGWYTWTPNGANYYWVWGGDIAISTNQDWHFGFYDTVAKTNDQIIYTAKNYLPVFSAGNECGSVERGPATQPVYHYEFSGNNTLWTNKVRPLDDANSGFHTLSSYGVSKNNLVVAAVNTITNGYSGSNSVVRASFSSCGPTAEGRIKPDISADGVNIYSTFATNNHSYGLDSGTSMSAPAVTGALGMLLDLYQRLYGSNATPMLSSTLKGVVLHTADESGTNAGPDYKFGWGLLDVPASANLISNNYASSSLAFIKEVRLVSGDYIQFPVVLTNGKAFKATIVWTDPPGTPTSPAINPTNHMLINDLDIRVITPSGATNFPWVLNPNLPANAATTGDNSVDNIEQVSIPNPTTGTYQVRVTHKGVLRDDLGQTNSQNVSILLSGNIAQTAILPEITSVKAMTIAGTVALKWNTEVGRVYRVQYRDAVNTGLWSNASGEISATKTNTAFTVSTTGVNTRFYRIVQVR